MPDIHASAEVRKLIGAETLQRLESDAFASYSCVRCHRAGRTAQPTTVVVCRYHGDRAEVELAHASCTASQIVEIDASPPDRSGAGMRAVTLALGYPDEPAMRPLLLLEPRIETIGPTQGEERVTVLMATLLGYGLTLMTSGSQLPGLAGGWRLHRAGPDRARLVAAGGPVVYSGPCDQPGEWVRLVDGAAACVVLAGSIGLYAVPDHEFTEARIRLLLDHAAHAGLLAGGLVVGAGSQVARLGRAAQPAELRRRMARSWCRPS